MCIRDRYNIGNMTTITDEQKTQFFAEIKFLRSVAYMDLTDAWGPVPLITETDVANATSSSYTSQPVPAPVERIDSMIIADLNTASSVLPVNYVSNATVSYTHLR